MANLVYPIQRIEEDSSDFDSDFSPDNPHNKEITEKLGLIYDSKKENYLDEDGCLIRDRFGQRI